MVVKDGLYLSVLDEEDGEWLFVQNKFHALNLHLERAQMAAKILGGKVEVHHASIGSDASQ